MIAASASRPLPLETNIPGVFAVGDMRGGSVKRVGAAIGEGAAVVAQLHTVLDDSGRSRTGAAPQAIPALTLPD